MPLKINDEVLTNYVKNNRLDEQNTFKAKISWEEAQAFNFAQITNNETLKLYWGFELPGTLPVQTSITKITLGNTEQDVSQITLSLGEGKNRSDKIINIKITWHKLDKQINDEAFIKYITHLIAQPQLTKIENPKFSLPSHIVEKINITNMSNEQIEQTLGIHLSSHISFLKLKHQFTNLLAKNEQGEIEITLEISLNNKTMPVKFVVQGFSTTKEWTEDYLPVKSVWEKYQNEKIKFYKTDYVGKTLDYFVDKIKFYNSKKIKAEDIGWGLNMLNDKVETSFYVFDYEKGTWKSNQPNWKDNSWVEILVKIRKQRIEMQTTIKVFGIISPAQKEVEESFRMITSGMMEINKKYRHLLPSEFIKQKKQLQKTLNEYVGDKWYILFYHTDLLDIFVYPEHKEKVWNVLTSGTYGRFSNLKIDDNKRYIQFDLYLKSSWENGDWNYEKTETITFNF